MVAFINDHRQAYGVESICRVVPIAPSTYYRHRVRQLDPTTDPAQRLRELERENKELRRANEILKKAAAYFAQAELDRRGT